MVSAISQADGSLLQYCYINSPDSLTLLATSLLMVHSNSLLHRWRWFTHLLCYIYSNGSVIHELCLWILVALSPLSSQSQIFVPRPFIHLIHSCLLVSYTLVISATSSNMVHSIGLLHQGNWFTQPQCYILDNGSDIFTTSEIFIP